MKDEIRNNAIKTKSKNFAIKVVELYKHIAYDLKENVLSKQFLRSGTSIGANIAESEFAASEADFLNKLYISLKETNETAYWLELLYETKYLTKKEFDNIYNECKEIRKLLIAITKTLKEKMLKL